MMDRTYSGYYELCRVHVMIFLYDTDNAKGRQTV